MAIEDFLEPVYTITDRPDLSAETLAVLPRALQQAHYTGANGPGSGFYNFDRQLFQIASTGEIKFAADLPARFRKVDSIMGNVVYGGQQGAGFECEEIAPRSIYNPQAFVGKRFCYYIAGNSINFIIQAAFQTMDMLYYKNPSWDDSKIAADFPHIITYFAAAKIFALVDNQAMAQKWEGLGQQATVEILQSYLAME